MVVAAKAFPSIKYPTQSITMLNTKTNAEIGIWKKFSIIIAIPVVPPRAIPEGRTKSLMLNA